MSFSNVFDSSLVDYSSDLESSDKNYLIDKIVDKLVFLFKTSHALNVDFENLKYFFKNYLNWDSIFRHNFRKNLPIYYYINMKMFIEDVYGNDSATFENWENLLSIEENIHIRNLNHLDFDKLYDEGDLIYAMDEEEFYHNGKDLLKHNDGAAKYYFNEIVYNKKYNTLLFSLNPYAFGGDSVAIRFK